MLGRGRRGGVRSWLAGWPGRTASKRLLGLWRAGSLRRSANSCLRYVRCATGCRVVRRPSLLRITGRGPRRDGRAAEHVGRPFRLGQRVDLAVVPDGLGRRAREFRQLTRTPRRPEPFPLAPPRGAWAGSAYQRSRGGWQTAGSPRRVCLRPHRQNSVRGWGSQYRRRFGRSPCAMGSPGSSPHSP